MNRPSKSDSAHKMFAVATMVSLAVFFSRTAVCQTYWYETYQRAVELIDEGSTAAAKPLIDRLIEEHPVPISGYMLPGERFIDYLPYYQRARIQFMDGDTSGATRSLDMSEQLGAMLHDRRSRRAVERLKLDIAVHSDSPALKEPPANTIASTAGPR